MSKPDESKIVEVELPLESLEPDRDLEEFLVSLGVKFYER